LDSSIIEIENFIPKEYCDYSISYFSNIANTQIEKIFIWGTTFVYSICGDPDFNDPIIKEITKKIEDLVTNRIFKDPSVVSDEIEIVFWDKGSWQHLHFDRDYRIYSVILYLNDDYEGGETFLVPNKIIKPKTGKLVGFYGSKIEHEVKEVLNGRRYTIPVWFRLKDKKQ
jgi:prolyl 4-hydroxylase